MNYSEKLAKLKEIQRNFLTFLENDYDIEENYQRLDIKLTDFIKSYNDRHDLKMIIYLISTISRNHFRGPNFFDKIFRIIQYLKDYIMKNFTNIEIFEIFKSNKMVLLFLIQEKIVNIDKTILQNMYDLNYEKKYYFLFFQPEIMQAMLKDKANSKKEIFQNELEQDFYEKRKIGENDHFICKLIREDSIDKFISYVEKNEYPLNSIIEDSIYETNPLLLSKNPTLIEYASFFGSIQIFKYLYLNEVKLTQSLWIYGVHGMNEEIIRILEDNHIVNNKEKCFSESIKCHHNSTAIYIENEFLHNHHHVKSNNFLSYYFHYYNFLFFPDDLSNNSILFFACRYDYYKIVEYLIKTRKIDFKKTMIYNFCLITFHIYVKLIKFKQYFFLISHH